jgi:hypothetical protein
LDYCFGKLTSNKELNNSKEEILFGRISAWFSSFRDCLYY